MSENSKKYTQDQANIVRKVLITKDF